MSDRSFQLFGVSHFAALVTVGLAAAGLALLVRRRPGLEPFLRVAMAGWLLGAGVGFVLVDALAGVPWRYIAPFHLCDLAVFVGALALLRRDRTAAELTYFWGIAGTLPAMLTPDLNEAFPHHRFIFYFAQHGGIVVAALLLTVGLGMPPRRGGVVRAWLWLNAVAVLVVAVNYALDANFLYLRAKPPSPTPLDWFGPWPLYLLVSEALAFGLFMLLDLPFRPARAGRRPLEGSTPR